MSFFLILLFLSIFSLGTTKGDASSGNIPPLIDEAIQALLAGPFLPEYGIDGSSSERNRYMCIPGEEKPVEKDYRFRGTSLGGWLVLEPWITPSLFYQFLGAKKRYGRSKGHVAFDSYTFCEVLGSAEATANFVYIGSIGLLRSKFVI